MTILNALLTGARLALGFNPLVAIVTAAVGGALLSRAHGGRSSAFAWGTVVLGWLLGDGLRVLARARDLADGLGAGAAATGSAAPPVVAIWVALALWALGGFAIGYALPAAVGAAVGRRVVWGTGWLAGGAVGASTAAMLVAIASAL